MSSTSFKKIVLHPAKERSLSLRHPWVFSGAVKKADPLLVEGEIVEVVSSLGDYLATGHFHEGSIKVRVFSFQATDAGNWVLAGKFQGGTCLPSRPVSY